MVVYTLTVISGEDQSFTVDVYETEKQAVDTAVKCILTDADTLGFNDPTTHIKETNDAFALVTSCLSTGKLDDIHVGICGWNDMPDMPDVSYEEHYFYTVEARDVITENTDETVYKASDMLGKPVPVVAKQEEKPCKVCKGMNYLDVKECWKCGNNPW